MSSASAETRRDWRQANPDKVRAHKARYRERHRERFNEAARRRKRQEREPTMSEEIIYSVAEVAKALSYNVNRVRTHSRSEYWADFVLPKTYASEPIRFRAIPPPLPQISLAPKEAKPQRKYPSKHLPPPLPEALKERLGRLLLPAAATFSFALDNEILPMPPAGAEPVSWAMYWLSRGLKIIPCEHMLGTPLTTMQKLYSFNRNDDAIIEHWGEQRYFGTPDIGCYPDSAGMFVIELHRDCPEVPDIDFSGALITCESAFGDKRYWFPGRCYTMLHGLGQWCHVIGIGRISYLPPSGVPAYVR
jgi:hypothetical protein